MCRGGPSGEVGVPPGRESGLWVSSAVDHSLLGLFISGVTLSGMVHGHGAGPWDLGIGISVRTKNLQFMVVHTGRC